MTIRICPLRPGALHHWMRSLLCQWFSLDAALLTFLLLGIQRGLQGCYCGTECLQTLRYPRVAPRSPRLVWRCVM
ncbi:hypothetical protein BGZ61DRAFT_464529 [Ilyonectria robusta]|uniref:uncharacterized protein n=1 Tax=Ilyonectria robusta TaxID=1079257 RepID=UPI001E8E76CE|nr:uncharacterized protein BGZ61DRAFT_464529 [Ilyonectria robusta]KAH8661024.1 hypothetical protein BGZ61DRAFT_464529 [Ilyonectria robusta]